MLPKPMPSSCVYGCADPAFFGGKIPIGGAAGDQQSALFGQTCLHREMQKHLWNRLFSVDEHRRRAGIFGKWAGYNHRLGNQWEKFIMHWKDPFLWLGAAIQWLRDELRVIDSAADSEYMAKKVKDTHGCYVVPAFTGLGAPYWDQYARGTIVGLTVESTNTILSGQLWNQ